MAGEISEVTQSEVMDASHATDNKEQPKEDATNLHKVKDFFNRRFQHKPGRLKSAAAVTAATVVLGSGANAIVSEIKYDNPTAVAEHVAGYVTEEGPRTDKQIIESISSKLAQADHPGEDKMLTAAKRYQDTMFDKYMGGKTDLTAERKSFAEYDQLYKKFVREQAAKYGLTVIDGEPFKERVKNAQSVDAVFAIVNEFTTQYGFEVGIEKSGKTGQNVEEIKGGADGLFSAFSTIPTELAKLGDLKKMEIAADDHLPNDEAAHYDPLSEKIEMKYSAFRDGANMGNDYVHELAHAIDKKLSGGSWAAERDGEFKEPNPSGFTYGEDEANDEKEYKEVNARAYGETNVLEDKATMAENLFDGISPEMFNSKQTSLTEKRDILLARLEERVPHITDYLKAISSKTVEYDALESDNKLLAQLGSDNKNKSS